MPDWLSKLHPAALLGGLAVMALAALDHQQQGWAKDWSTADWTLLLGGFTAVVGSPLVTGIGNAITDAAVSGAQSAQPAMDIVGALHQAMATGVAIGQASNVPIVQPTNAPAPTGDLAPGTTVHP